MKKVNFWGDSTPFTLYMLASLLCVLIWVPCPDLCDYFGASSLVYAFMLSIVGEPHWIAYFSLIWLPIFIICLIVTYLIACTKQKFISFIVVVGFDLLFSILVLVYKSASDNYSSFIPMLIGFIVRSMYYAYMIYHTIKIKRKMEKV